MTKAKTGRKQSWWEEDPKRLQILRDLYPEHGSRAVADALGCTPRQAMDAAKRYSLVRVGKARPQAPKSWTAERVQMARELIYAHGVVAAAKIMGISYDQLSGAAKKHGLRASPEVAKKIRVEVGRAAAKKMHAKAAMKPKKPVPVQPRIEPKPRVTGTRHAAYIERSRTVQHFGDGLPRVASVFALGEAMA